MNAVTKRISVTVGLVALGATMVLACQTGAARMLVSQPSVVVSVSLSEVLEKLDQRAKAAVSLKAMADGFTATKQSREDELTAVQKEYDAIKDQADNPRVAELQEKAAAMLVDYQAWLRFATAKTDLEEALVMKDLYRTIKDAVRDMAESEGYDIVMVDDSRGEIEWSDDARVPRAVQVKQQIVARRTLYVSPTVDITDHLITRMNNAFKAGPHTAAPAPAVPPQ